MARLEVDGANVALNADTCNVSTLTPNRVGLCVEGDSAPSSALLGYFYDGTLFGATLSAPERAALDAALLAGT